MQSVRFNWMFSVRCVYEEVAESCCRGGGESSRLGLTVTTVEKSDGDEKRGGGYSKRTTGRRTGGDLAAD